MEWHIAAGRPVYIQLVEQLERAVVTGVYPPGERVPAVRDLAAQASVNPNTMQRALAALEESGLVSAQRNTGRYVTQDEACIRETRRSLAQAEIDAFCARMRQLGYTQEEIATLFGGNENE